jgi:hypothetical protein
MISGAKIQKSIEEKSTTIIKTTVSKDSLSPPFHCQNDAHLTQN